MAVAWRRVLTVDDGTLLSATTQTISGAKTVSSTVASGSTGTNGYLNFKRSSDGANAGGVGLSSTNVLDLTASGGSYPTIRFLTDSTLALSIDESQDATFSGTVTWSSGGSANANTAYTHSQVSGGVHASGTVTSIATSGTVSGITLTGGTITGSGTITLGGAVALDIGDLDNVTVSDGAASGGVTGDIWIEY